MSFHKIYYKNSNNMKEVEDNSIALVITSPPYPMIEMWDEMFSIQNPKIEAAFKQKKGVIAFKLIHKELNKTWKEVYRILIPGGIACINIGDATRTIDKNFQLFPSHAIIINNFLELGFQSLPEILWRKQTNAPNKFMGSGMMPPGAYVTLEHEYLLLFRKGKKREFKKPILKDKRRESSYFWEERNIWFSDIWLDLKGTNQKLKNSKTRERSASYPLELAYRVINMFSIKDDIITDPFLGRGTSTIAAMLCERNSIGYEIDPKFKMIIEKRFKNMNLFANNYINKRIKSHINFINKRIKEKGFIKHNNEIHNFPVVSSQEKLIKIHKLKSIKRINKNEFKVEYKKL
ncbi:hypothetical protein LCGC14_0893580 [marine sediment metagenome]|uniref:site-specific DNA-methyltransferase (cytosine-N(4)-specific) n=1 Tax=marine sediment metagenome TaxID=412755 RepID=A0A0F9P3A8_9ZZZZ